VHGIDDSETKHHTAQERHGAVRRRFASVLVGDVELRVTQPGVDVCTERAVRQQVTRADEIPGRFMMRLRSHVKVDSNPRRKDTARNIDDVQPETSGMAPP